ncbi:MAG: hypothetical protein QNK25_01905 [Desulfobacterales bacterium]|nr:hypothetical protein [Desulfobacterales bacterium]
MNKLSKKTAFVLIGILTLSLVAGNVLFADDRGEAAWGLISEDDVAFVSGAFVAGSGSGSNQDSQLTGSLVSAADLDFLAEPFNETLVATGSSGSEASYNVVTAADINFIRNGLVGSDTSNLVCMVDGVQASGKLCVN